MASIEIRTQEKGFRSCPVLPALILLLAVGALVAACTPSKPAIDHMAVARQMAAKITEQEGGQTDYSRSVWEDVAMELQLVPEGAADKVEADAWLKEIRDARKAKLFATYERNGGSVAYKVKPSRGSSGGARSIGLPPPPDTIDVDAIARRVHAGSVGSGGYAGPTGSSSSSKSSSSAVTSGPKHVIIYTTSWCGVCKAAKQYMRSKGISFVEKDIEKDPAARAEKEAKVGKTSVPVIDVDGQILVGFDRAALDKML